MTQNEKDDREGKITFGLAMIVFSIPLGVGFNALCHNQGLAIAFGVVMMVVGSAIAMLNYLSFK